MFKYDMVRFGKKTEEDAVVNKRSDRREGQPLYMTPPHVHAALVMGNVGKLVPLPEFVDLNEWLAANTYDFFHHINMLYGTVSEFCNIRECPVMSAGHAVEYLWTSSDQKSTRMPAPQYIDYVMTWVQSQLDDETVFPSRAGGEFPKNFGEIVRTAFKRLFRVLAHLYHSHYDKIVVLGEEAHLNSLFAHFVAFAREFRLADEKELAPMHDLILQLEHTGVIPVPAESETSLGTTRSTTSNSIVA